jgi:xanthine dehydrogenase accessory factor
MVKDIYEELMLLRKAYRPCALATVVQTTGSSPQRAGAKLLVHDDGSITGTIGGGCVEARVIELGLLSMTDGSARTVPFDLTETEGGLVCGGHMIVFVEPVLPDPLLVIIGAGHVGKALATIARFAGFRVIIVDDREAYADPAHVPVGCTVLVNAFSSPLRGVPADDRTCIVVATRGHSHDLEAVAAALETGAGYIGLVGSKRKRGIVFGTLADRGFSQDDLERVEIPAGLPIGAVTPEEIAVSIMGRMIETRRKHDGSLGHSPCCGTIETDGTAQAAPAHR